MKKMFYYGLLIFFVCICVCHIYALILDKSGEKNRLADIGNSTNDVIVNHIDSGIIETVSGDEKLSPNASFAFKKYHNMCNHFDFQFAELPVELINLSKSEIILEYKEWNVEAFNSNELILSKKIDDMCNEHFFIKLSDDYIEIYNVISEDDFKLYKETDIAREYLTAEDVETLENGIYVFGKGKLNSIIEDFE